MTNFATSAAAPKIHSFPVLPSDQKVREDNDGTAGSQWRLPSADQIFSTTRKTAHQVHAIVNAQSFGGLLKAVGLTKNEVENEVEKIIQDLTSGKEVNRALDDLSDLAATSAERRAQRDATTEQAPADRNSSVEVAAAAKNEAAPAVSEKEAEPAANTNEIAIPEKIAKEMDGVPSKVAGNNGTLRDMLSSFAGSLGNVFFTVSKPAESVSQESREARSDTAGNRESRGSTEQPAEERITVEELQTRHDQICARLVESVDEKRGMPAYLASKVKAQAFPNFGSYLMKPSTTETIMATPIGKDASAYAVDTGDIVLRRLGAWAEQQLGIFVGHMLEEDNLDTREKIVDHLRLLSSVANTSRQVSEVLQRSDRSQIDDGDDNLC